MLVSLSKYIRSVQDKNQNDISCCSLYHTDILLSIIFKNKLRNMVLSCCYCRPSYTYRTYFIRGILTDAMRKYSKHITAAVAATSDATPFIECGENDGSLFVF